ncbi:Bax inhibitor-1/YccA family protein [Chamaesiphon minutus]|uniref:FtsH-interacting integral membrane protein n=1 Tax=Chamaesiphon minutus (strain ATCC 27169 / PCC 6605) TaxID=1173020 RepID=K9UHC0_CHAP6|nr:Bax inhibitor-1 family protein [Chamaesiphon minutus]AFY94043.1 FtsH-interacting integral membrane protein [Chamaesiphon minutus PCC 6605]
MYVVAQEQPRERAEFIRKTYAHLAGAVGAFIAIETFLVQSGIAETLARALTGGMTWLAVLAGFSLLGWLSRGLANRADSVSLQYLGLGIYVVAEALLFAPLIFIASRLSDPTVIPTAGILTALMFVGLTAVALTTGKDFTFLGGALKIGGFVALGLIICSVIFGFQLGLFFSVLMVGFAMAAILYDTSQIMTQFSKDQYVAAALSLFASVALLFWYVLRIVMSMSRR